MSLYVKTCDVFYYYVFFLTDWWQIYATFNFAQLYLLLSFTDPLQCYDMSFRGVR